MRICLIFAMRAEAQPVIEYFGLKEQESFFNPLPCKLYAASPPAPLSKRGAGGESLSPKLAALLDHWQGGGEVKEDERLNNAKQDSKMTRQVIDAHKQNFRQEIDVRGLRGDEALLEVQHFIDDAILIGSHNVRILHGKGNGILRELIRNYLNALPNVIGCRDEHIQFGGSGITVVDLG